MNRTDIKEKIIFVAFSTGIFLPVRFFFYTYVSTWWVGSFGLISVIMVVLLYLTKKEKLGYFGRIWKKQIYKISKGKLGIIIMIQSVIMIMVFSTIVYITDFNQNTPEVQRMIAILEGRNMTSLDDVLLSSEFADNIRSKTLEGWYLVIVEMINNPVIVGQSYALIDYTVQGWHQHINIVLLVEEIETLGLIVYFRFGNRIIKVLKKSGIIDSRGM